jgi:hypothetical protein
MVEVAIPSNMSHEILGFPATSPILSGSKLDDNNTDITDITDFGSDAATTGAITQVSKISGHLRVVGCGHFCWAAMGNPGGSDR